MRKVLKLISFVLIFTMILSTAVFAKVNTPDLDVKTSILKVSGVTKSEKAGRMVTLMVLNPGYTPETALSDGKAIQSFDNIVSGENGAFDANILINVDNVENSGMLTVYIGGDDYEDGYEKAEKYFATPSDISNALAEFNDLTLDADKETAYYKALVKNGDILDYNNDAFKAVDKEKLAKLLYSTKGTTVYTKDNVQGIIKEGAIVRALNENKKDALLDGLKLVYASDIDLSLTDTDSSTLNQIFDAGVINETGIKAILDSLFGNDYKNYSNLRDDFAKKVIFYGIANAADGGTAHIQKLLTDANIKRTGMSLPKYKALTSAQKSAANTIILNSSYTTMDELASVIESAATEAAKSITGGQGSPSGGGGTPSGGKDNTAITATTKDATSTISPGTTEEPPVDETGFRDLSEYEWAKKAIVYLRDNKVVDGIGNSYFSPEQNMTREQLAKIICIAFGIDVEDSTETKFSDVPVSEWYGKFVNTAAENGIIKGFENGEFGVGQYITRQDLAVIIARALKLDDYTEGAFTDKDSISDYAANSVFALANAKIINGFEDGTFKPFAPVTRAEACQMIYNAVMYKEGK